MNRSLVLLSVIALCLPAFAQQQVSSDYANEKAAAVAALLDQTLTDDQRIEAIQGVGYATKGINALLLTLAKNNSESDAVRIAAIKKHRFEPEWMDYVLEAIVDPTESDQLSANMVKQISQRITFRQPAELRQRVQGVLREVLSDSRPQTRQIAFHTLVAAHDHVAIEQLVEGLRGNIPLAMSPADAIHILHTDGPSRHIETVRPFLTDPDKRVRAEAVKILAADPQSRQTITAMVGDRAVGEQIRINAMRALVREDQKIIPRLILVILNDAESPDLRYAAMENGMRRLNYHEVAAKDQIAFAEAIRRLMRTGNQVTTKGKNLGVEAKKLFEHLQRNFPVIKFHYQRQRPG